jgi:hypothetical protein
MAGNRHPTPSSQRAVEAWVALGAGLAVGSPEGDSRIGRYR